MTAGRCSDLSRAAGETLGATATTAEQWLLIEVGGAWPRDVSDRLSLPERAHAAAAAWLEQTPLSRALFIRRPARPRGRHAVFVVRARELESEVRRIELASLDELGEVDLTLEGRVVDTQLVLVCGHGARDRCCAVHGTAVYGALVSRLGEEELWLSSHHGGHRFSANVLVLPTGLHLGRVQPEDAAFLVARALAGRIDLVHYRGRTCYPPLVQAAERAVREATGLEAVTDLLLQSAEGGRVHFRSWDGNEHEALANEIDGPTVPASCGAEPEPQRAFTARIV